MPSLLNPLGTAEALVRRIRREAERNALRARNGIKVVTGLDAVPVGATPKDVVWTQDRCSLYRYRSDQVSYYPPLFICFSLVSRSYILDLHPGNSFVEHLRDAGLDVFLLDFGVADERDSQNTLEDYVDGYLPEAMRQALEVAGADELNLLGYCFGGDLALLTVARHPELPIRSLTTVATPTDFTKMGLMTEAVQPGNLEVDELVDDTGNIPPNVLRQAFRVLKPTADLSKYANLLQNLESDKYLVAHRTMTQWTEDHIPFPGEAARQTVDQLVRRNGLMNDDIRLGGRPVHLADITCPFLNVVAERDHIVPVEAAAPLIDLVGSTDKGELRLQAGHIGLAVGKTAARVTIPTIVEFLQKRSEKLPDPETTEVSA
ncbi:MAG TPA: alpha/beta fold hydrolase [Frankiaceae bacterium]|nr:alpha/beta fold hydrolase [Frankiaceae bacterium]